MHEHVYRYVEVLTQNKLRLIVNNVQASANEQLAACSAILAFYSTVESLDNETGIMGARTRAALVSECLSSPCPGRKDADWHQSAVPTAPSSTTDTSRWNVTNSPPVTFVSTFASYQQY